MHRAKPAIATIVSILFVVPVGLYTKLYQGAGAFWVNNSLSGVFYEIFWCLTIFLFWPSLKPLTIAATEFSITCALEFLQLWHPRFLEVIRASWIGQALIGNQFVWSDFLYYFIGCAAGWWWLTRLRSGES